MASPPAVPRLPPHDPRTPALSVVDMHTGGEPLRIVLAGCPEVVGPTLLAKRRYMRQHLDHVRRRLMFEPRGHRDMYGAVLVPSELPDAHLGVLFLHNEGYSSMCGHAVLALGRFALDFGLVPAPPAGAREVLVNIHCPCGLVAAFVECEGGRSGGPVRFHSVPAFALATGNRRDPYGPAAQDPTNYTVPLGWNARSATNPPHKAFTISKKVILNNCKCVSAPCPCEFVQCMQFDYPGDLSVCGLGRALRGTEFRVSLTQRLVLHSSGIPRDFTVG